jgi:hypothetical protein
MGTFRISVELEVFGEPGDLVLLGAPRVAHELRLSDSGNWDELGGTGAARKAVGHRERDV